MSNWNPKPMRPAADTLLFGFVEQPTVVKGMSPLQHQRQVDGTPITRQGPSALRAPDMPLTLSPELINKGSLVAQIDKKHGKYSTPRTDPDPMSVVKAFLDSGNAESKAQNEVCKSTLTAFNVALAALNKSCGLGDVEKSEDDVEKSEDDVEKSDLADPVGPAKTKPVKAAKANNSFKEAKSTGSKVANTLMKPLNTIMSSARSAK